MAVSTYSTNLTDLYAGAGSTTNWSALGGGASGLNAETDYFIQGTGMTSKNAFASTKKGMIFNSGADRAATIGTDGAVLIWTTHATPNSVDLIANGGIDLLVGSSTSDYKHWYVGGGDTIEFMGWIIAAVNPSETTGEADTGTPSAVEQYFGMLFDLPTGGPTKGAPNAIDAIRVGRCDLIYELGTSTDPDASFTLAVADKGDVTDRLGLIQERSGAFFLSGLHQYGSATNAVNFTDSNKTLFWNDHPSVTAPFNTVEIQNASSIINISNISWKALGTKSPGTWVTTDNGTVNLTSMNFIDWGAFAFGTNTTVLTSTFLGCSTITQNGATITDCTVSESTDTSALLIDTAVEAADITGVSFVDNNVAPTNAHSIELTATGNHTFTDITFSGGGGTPGSNPTPSSGSATADVYNNSGGLVTINVSGGDAPSVRNAAGSTTVVNNNVAVTFDGMKDLTEVRVYTAGTSTELDGIENATAGTTDDRSFIASVSGGTSVDYVLHSVLYETIRVENFTWPSTASTIPVQQRFDRNNDNP